MAVTLPLKFGLEVAGPCNKYTLTSQISCRTGFMPALVLCVREKNVGAILYPERLKRNNAATATLIDENR